MVRALPLRMRMLRRTNEILMPTCNRKRRNVKTKKNQKEQPGDVLGISNPGGPKLPHPPSDGSTPRGIEVRGEPTRHWGTRIFRRATVRPASTWAAAVRARRCRQSIRVRR